MFFSAESLSVSSAHFNARPRPAAGIPDYIRRRLHFTMLSLQLLQKHGVKDAGKRCGFSIGFIPMMLMNENNLSVVFG